MGLFFKKYATTAEYNTYINSNNKILPNVSICDDTNIIYYNPAANNATHEYVEIGGIKWATMNLGATTETDTGLYFQWADTQGYTLAQTGNDEGQKLFDMEHYRYTDLTTYNPQNEWDVNMTKYNNTDKLEVIEIVDDAAQANWHDNWKIPTLDDYNELKYATTQVWASDYNGTGVAGVIVTDKEDNTKQLFFPACGSIDEEGIYGNGEIGYYWCSTLYYKSQAYCLTIEDQLPFDLDTEFGWNRAMGMQIRPILDE